MSCFYYINTRRRTFFLITDQGAQVASEPHPSEHSRQMMLRGVKTTNPQKLLRHRLLQNQYSDYAPVFSEYTGWSMFALAWWHTMRYCHKRLPTLWQLLRFAGLHLHSVLTSNPSTRRLAKSTTSCVNLEKKKKKNVHSHYAVWQGPVTGCDNEIILWLPLSICFIVRRAQVYMCKWQDVVWLQNSCKFDSKNRQ